MVLRRACHSWELVSRELPRNVPSFHILPSYYQESRQQLILPEDAFCIWVSYPGLSISACLEQMGTEPQEIVAASIGVVHLLSPRLYFPSSTPSPKWDSVISWWYGNISSWGLCLLASSWCPRPVLCSWICFRISLTQFPHLLNENTDAALLIKSSEQRGWQQCTRKRKWQAIWGQNTT